jgi:hypothetical protein
MPLDTICCRYLLDLCRSNTINENSILVTAVNEDHRRRWCKVDLRLLLGRLLGRGRTADALLALVALGLRALALRLARRRLGRLGLAVGLRHFHLQASQASAKARTHTEAHKGTDEQNLTHCLKTSWTAETTIVPKAC